jgi:hypothetical protein
METSSPPTRFFGGNGFTNEIEEWGCVIPRQMSNSVVCPISEAEGL